MDKAHLKEKLEDSIIKTKKSIANYQEMTKPIAPDVAYGRVSRMDAINNKSIFEAALRKNQEKLKNLEFMLQEIDAKDFGKCVSCGNPIAIERLLIRPESIRCQKCAD
ncbi:MAG: TraR/DksA C4-type zinc finger protein [Flavobacteriaceae bacterium]|nr:TraR/DksA C4-type zinc finger protein [Flavobacteriaceae bacterium]